MDARPLGRAFGDARIRRTRPVAPHRDASPIALRGVGMLVGASMMLQCVEALAQAASQLFADPLMPKSCKPTRAFLLRLRLQR